MGLVENEVIKNKLTEHQLFHLDAILEEAEVTRKLSYINKEKLMICKHIKSGEENNYLDEIVKNVLDIKKSGIFPELDSTAVIHDYIEKETKDDFRIVKYKLIEVEIKNG